MVRLFFSILEHWKRESKAPLFSTLEDGKVFLLQLGALEEREQNSLFSTFESLLT
jgi:hypothetical protein